MIMEKQVIIYRRLPHNNIIQADIEDYLFFDIADDPLDNSGIYIPSDEEMLFEERNSIAEKTIDKIQKKLPGLRYVNIAVSRMLKESEISVLKATARMYKKQRFNITICPCTGDILKRMDEALLVLASEGVCTSNVILAGVVPSIDNIRKLILLSKSGIKIIYNGFFDKRINKEVITEEQLVSIKYLIKLGFIKNIMLSSGMYEMNMRLAVSENVRLWDELLKIGVSEDQVSEMSVQNPKETYY